ncbi:MAG: hypothetical protein Q8O46_05630 [bacterium]|nr:hypothetical protein [bacterium]
MYITLILFFTSLLGIILMIGQKLVLLRNGMTVNVEHFHPFTPDFMKIKYLTKKGLQRGGYLALVAVLRFNIRLSNLIKSQYQEIKNAIKETIHKKIQSENKMKLEGHEVSRFLKMMSEYKSKIRNIKQKIRKEEEER